MEVIFGFYGREADEIAVRNLQFTISPWNIWMMIFVGMTYFLPVSIWLSKSLRRNLWVMSLACIFVNIGMWLERFLIIVPGLARKQLLTFDWYTYRPSSVEWIIITGTFALVSMLMLIIARVVPLIPLYDIKEGEILRTEIKIGRVTVPAVFRED
jgi:molybdopterin-containing oxidoreductase family membrane subunit